MNKTRALDSVLRKIEDVTMIVLGLAMFLIVGIQVIVRFVPNVSVPWTLELTEILFAAMIWLGMGIGIRDNSHAALTVLEGRLPNSMQKVVEIINKLLFAGYLIFLTIVGWKMCKFYLARNLLTPALHLPYFLTRLPIVVGSILALIRLLEGNER